MIGTTLTHPQSGITGKVDAAMVLPTDEMIVRICDAWFFARDCVAA